MKKIRKAKRPWSKYKKRITAALILYGLFTALCEVSVLLSVLAVPREKIDIALWISLPVACALFFGGSALMLFIIVPRLKKAQALEDFKRYDFSPYSEVAENETFEYEYKILSYTFKTEPFDCDESVVLTGEKAIKTYLEQFGNSRLVSGERFHYSAKRSPFFVGYFFGEEITKTRVEKKVDGDNLTVNIYDLHRAEFTPEGIKIWDKVYSYEFSEAEVTATFDHSTDFTVSVRLILFFEDDGVLSFEFSTRIAEIIKKYNIHLTNPEVLDYILKDPKNAFIQTALQLNLRKLK